MTLYTSVSTRAFLLDLVPRMDSQTFIKSFKRFICRIICHFKRFICQFIRRGCLSNAVWDNGKNFFSDETQSYVHNLGMEWHVNLPMAPWDSGFFERLLRIGPSRIIIQPISNHALPQIICYVVEPLPYRIPIWMILITALSILSWNLKN